MFFKLLLTVKMPHVTGGIINKNEKPTLWKLSYEYMAYLPVSKQIFDPQTAIRNLW